MNGARVGTWSLPPNAPDVLQYDLAWTQSGQGRPLSLSIAALRSGQRAAPWSQGLRLLRNLLPDSKENRERLTRRFNTGSTGAFELQAEIGRTAWARWKSCRGMQARRACCPWRPRW